MHNLVISAAVPNESLTYTYWSNVLRATRIHVQLYEIEAIHCQDHTNPTWYSLRNDFPYITLLAAVGAYYLANFKFL
jgi:hypothetical protein